MLRFYAQGRKTSDSWRLQIFGGFHRRQHTPRMTRLFLTRLARHQHRTLRTPAGGRGRERRILNLTAGRTAPHTRWRLRSLVEPQRARLSRAVPAPRGGSFPMAQSARPMSGVPALQRSAGRGVLGLDLDAAVADPHAETPFDHELDAALHGPPFLPFDGLNGQYLAEERARLGFLRATRRRAGRLLALPWLRKPSGPLRAWNRRARSAGGLCVASLSTAALRAGQPPAEVDS